MNEGTTISTSISMGTGSTTASPIGAHILPPPTTTSGQRKYYTIKVKFEDNQIQQSINPSLKDAQLKYVINQKIANKEFFYGLEIMARTYEPNVTLDYNSFGPLLPLFTSIVWLGMDYWKIDDLEDVEAIHLAHSLGSHVRVLPHLSCYRLTEERLRHFLNLNFSNVLSVRGDFYDRDQTYKHSSELVEAIRSIRGGKSARSDCFRTTTNAILLCIVINNFFVN